MPLSRTPEPVDAPEPVGSLRDAHREPLLRHSPDDSHSLLREYARTRDIRIRNRLVLLHERVVHYVAGRFSGVAAASTEDLVQVGFIGLISAIERYDIEHGASFVSFAVPTILGVIKHYLRDHTWGLKAPRELRELGLKLRRLRDQLGQTLGRPPTVTEMAAAAGVSEEQLLQAMDLDHVYQPASLDSFAPDTDGDEGAPVNEATGRVDPGFDSVEHRETVRSALERLDHRLWTVIYYRFFEEATQSEVARRLGISQMHVSRLERKALTHLRTLLP